MKNRGWDALTAFLQVLTAIMVASVVLGVVSRYVFNRPVVFSFELSTVMLAYVTFWGLALAARSESNITIDLVVNVLPGRARLLAQLCAELIVLAICVVFAYYGVVLTMRTGMELTALQVSAKWLYAAFPTGFSLFGLYTLGRVRELLNRFSTTRGDHGVMAP